MRPVILKFLDRTTKRKNEREKEIIFPREIFLKLFLTSYTISLRVINSGGGLWITRRKVREFEMVSDLLEGVEVHTLNDRFS